MKVAKVTVDLTPLKKFTAELTQQEQTNPKGPLLDAFKKCARHYRIFARTRFLKLSQGGGEWPPLALCTIKAKGHAKILIETGLLLGALKPSGGAPGAWEQMIPGGIRVGYGGPARYPEYPHRKIAEVALFHQTGDVPIMPMRRVIVAPDAQTKRAMAKEVATALKEVGKQVSGISKPKPKHRQTLSPVRGFLYDLAKILGDISSVMGVPITQRRILYDVAKALGDVSAIAGGTIGTRFIRKTAGQFTAKRMQQIPRMKGVPGRIVRRAAGKLTSRGLKKTIPPIKSEAVYYE